MVVCVKQSDSKDRQKAINLGELLLYSHGIKGGFFVYHSQVDTSAFQEKCKNLK